MPTNTNAYNSRVTDEALEKRFRDTFRSQGGAELVDDLYAQGVIVPVVDFTAAATGQQLGTNLQTAWDFSTGHNNVVNTTTTLISNAGFWLVDVVSSIQDGGAFSLSTSISITDGLTSKKIYSVEFEPSDPTGPVALNQEKFVVFLRSGDSLTATSNNPNANMDIVYRQIATISGDLVNPTGFTSS